MTEILSVRKNQTLSDKKNHFLRDVQLSRNPPGFKNQTQKIYHKYLNNTLSISQVHLGCYFLGPTANLLIHGQTFANNFFRLRLLYLLFVR